MDKEEFNARWNTVYLSNKLERLIKLLYYAKPHKTGKKRLDIQREQNKEAEKKYYEKNKEKIKEKRRENYRRKRKNDKLLFKKQRKNTKKTKRRLFKK